MADARDISDVIERIDAFETRNGVRMEGLYAKLTEVRSELFVTVIGELHALAGRGLSSDLEIVISVHDDKGRVVATDVTYISEDTFFGFEVFSERIEVPRVDIAKIRVYPKAS